MKRITFGIVSLCLGLGISDGTEAQTRELGSSGELLDGIAALVDSGVVLKSELQSRIEVVAENFAQQQAELPPDQRGQLPPLAVFEEQVLDQLILEEIQIQRAERIGIEIGDDALNDVLANIADGVGTTLEEIPAWLESQGIDYVTFRRDQRRDLMIRSLERVEVLENIFINPRELEQCLAMSVMTENDQFDYHISHILIGFAPEASPEEVSEAEDRIREIVRQLDEGSDFAQLAVAYSESQTALEGGELGWRKGSELPTIFVADVVEMEVGGHSTPIRGGGGFHIVRLNDMRGSEPLLVDQILPRHILLQPTEVLDDDATRQRLQGIHDQIVEGDDFGTVASAVSEDIASAVDGGELGWVSRDNNNYDPEFSAALALLEVGELSQPFQTEFGWHIAQITDERSYDMTDDRRGDDCRNQIGQSKALEESELWRQRLLNETFVARKL